MDYEIFKEVDSDEISETFDYVRSDESGIEFLYKKVKVISIELRYSLDSQNNDEFDLTVFKLLNTLNTKVKPEMNNKLKWFHKGVKQELEKIHVDRDLIYKNVLFLIELYYESHSYTERLKNDIINNRQQAESFFKRLRDYMHRLKVYLLEGKVQKFDVVLGEIIVLIRSMSNANFYYELKRIEKYIMAKEIITNQFIDQIESKDELKMNAENISIDKFLKNNVSKKPENYDNSSESGVSNKVRLGGDTNGDTEKHKGKIDLSDFLKSFKQKKEEFEKQGKEFRKIDKAFLKRFIEFRSIYPYRMSAYQRLYKFNMFKLVYVVSVWHDFDYQELKSTDSNRDYSNPGYGRYCQACQESPCMCSDPNIW